MRALRVILVVDAAVLILLGLAFLVAPGRVEELFQFRDLPRGVDYIIGTWGCALATMGVGYAIAAENPLRNVAWVQVGIARGVLEVIFGILCVARGVVTLQQASFGLAAAALIALLYIVFYPREQPEVAPAATESGTQAQPRL